MPELDTTSYWIDSSSLPRFPKLDNDVDVDVAIIGGGIVGITAAYLLKSAGLTVALLERERCASVDTGHTTAHLTCVTDLYITDLIDDFGRDAAWAVWDAGRVAIDQIQANIEAEAIDCHFERVPGFLHESLEESDTSPAELQRQADAARELGIAATYLEKVPLFSRPGIRFENQARFHPRDYLSALARAIPGDGSHIFEHTTADEVRDDPLGVKAGDYTVRCASVVVATHNPLVGKSSLVSATLFQTKLALYSSYVVAARVAKGAVFDGLFWDTADPYNYLRIEPKRDYDLVIFGGQDHKTGQADDTTACYAALEETLERVLPEAKVEYHWSGQVIETNDGLPYIGETASRQFAATGFSGNGMTFGTLAAMMARDAALGRFNPWSDLLATDRRKLKGGTWDYLIENKDYLYYLVRDRFAAAQGNTLRTVKRGQGRILDLQGQRVAAYRDAKGTVTVRSAICTHMGCEVKWNQAESTWDCPCHGSRFKTEGSVLAGPAESPLSEVEAKK